MKTNNIELILRGIMHGAWLIETKSIVQDVSNYIGIKLTSESDK